VAISVHRQDNPYSSAFIRGRVVEVRTEGAEEQIHRLAKKYMGVDRYPALQPGEQRLTFVIEPEHVAAMMVE